jgi:hypothetical protein
MKVEALMPIWLHIAETGEDIQLKPMVPTELPEAQALKLLAKGIGKVRPFHPLESSQVKVGDTLSWKSPLFGRCNGQVAMEPENGWCVVRCHSVTGDLALIHLDWDVKVEPPR